MLKIKGLKTKGVSSAGNGSVEAKASASEFLGKAHERKPGDKVHICSRCDFPIAIYGQLWPCRHAFCLQCAEEMQGTCFLCFAQIEEIRKIEACKQPLFMCGVCLRTHDSLDELLTKVKQSGTGCCQPKQPQALSMMALDTTPRISNPI